jgi:gp178|nr:MAG TPA: Protein of unknown function (DUF1642) [Caudoviricetes sp.]
MNKQELIEKYKRLEGVWDAPGAETARQIFLQDLEQLDEPEKPVVPAVVSVWYQINKDNLYKNIAYLCANWVKSTNDDTLFNWISNTDNFIEIIVNMHKFGYEVEEKKRYRVKMKGMSEENTYLTFRFGHTWMLSNFEECEEFRLHHTRKELEDANFGWVFDCEGIEIEEVE